jgi:transcriptional regulator with XRE-family HTH domain
MVGKRTTTGEKRMKRLDWNRWPHPLLDYLLKQYGLRNDRQLCALLETAPSTLSRIRHGEIKGRAEIALAIHEVFGLSFKRMREMAGDDFIGSSYLKQRAKS